MVKMLDIQLGAVLTCTQFNFKQPSRLLHMLTGNILADLEVNFHPSRPDLMFAFLGLLPTSHEDKFDTADLFPGQVSLTRHEDKSA